MIDREPDLLDIKDDFPSVPDACRISFEILQADANKLKGGMKMLGNLISTIEQDAGDPSITAGVSKFAEEANTAHEVTRSKFENAVETYKKCCKFFGEPGP